MYISFSACAGVAAIYSEIVAQFSPECGLFSAILIPRLLHALARKNSPDRNGRLLGCADSALQKQVSPSDWLNEVYHMIIV